MISRLTALQRRLLSLLAGVEPRWSLTGGGALAGFHLGHRDTRDLDLFFRGLSELGAIPEDVTRRLVAEGLVVSVERQAPGYRRLIVEDGAERTIVDLVAEPVPSIEPPLELPPGVLVDTAHEVLVNKLNALLGRVALRDLLDVSALLAAGGDFERAVRDAHIKDGGFSPPTLAWLLSEFPVEPLARSAKLDPTPLLAARDLLMKRLVEPVPR